ncbi:BTB/POZ domain-containing protein KCTD17, partial [Aphelenchoides avenae]
IFQTATQTLRKEHGSFLAGLCDVDRTVTITKDESGAFFIDRDPRYFRIILNYLRSGCVYLEDKVSIEVLRTEADFYRLRGLIKLLDDLRRRTEKEEKKLPVRTACVSVNYDTTAGLRKFTMIKTNCAEILRQAEALIAASTLEAIQRSNYSIRLHHDSITVANVCFSIADACEILGQCGLVLRHVETSATKNHLHFSSP